ncbi:MAG: endonuclease/exonuclease/phosphatase [Pirellulaceae bacterium]
MRRFVSTLFLAVILVGGAWALYHRDKFQSAEQAWQFAQSQFASDSSSSVPVQLSKWEPSARVPNTIRVASFNLQAFNAEKIANETIAQRVAEIMMSFDVIAVQEILPGDQSALQRLVKKINNYGMNYAYSLSPSLGSAGNARQSAFIFNQSSIQLDDAFAYAVNDPQQVFMRQPYVGWFRAAQVRPDRALTFTLVNLDLDERKMSEEVEVLGALFRTVRKDTRDEDDVILLGNFQCDAQTLRVLQDTVGLRCAIVNQPTNTQRTRQLDNILYSSIATTEFTGERGVFDFLQQFNLTLEEALQISDHLPVWADFSIFEGDTPGRMAQEHGTEATR